MINNVAEGYWDEGVKRIIELGQRVRFNNGMSIVEGRIWQINQESYYSHTRSILILGNDGKTHWVS